MKILLPVDGSLASIEAAEDVARRPWPPGSVVRLLHLSDRAPDRAGGARSAASLR
jgi:hypothetical protein